MYQHMPGMFCRTLLPSNHGCHDNVQQSRHIGGRGILLTGFYIYPHILVPGSELPIHI